MALFQVGSLLLLVTTATATNSWFETVDFDSPNPAYRLSRTREIRTTLANDGHEANFWLVQGSSRNVLVDTGFGFENLKDHLVESGHLNSSIPLLVVATHEHFDHAAGMSAFEADGATLASGAGDADAIIESITQRTADEFVREMAKDIKTFWTDIPPSVADEGEFASELSTFQTQANIKQQLVEGDTIELGGGALLTVYELPGHTPGGLGLYDAESKTIFTGDTLYAGHLIYYAEDSNVADYDATMDRLAKLDIRHAFPGHGEYLTGQQFLGVVDCYFEESDDCSYVLKTPSTTATTQSGGSSNAQSKNHVKSQLLVVTLTILWVVSI